MPIDMVGAGDAMDGQKPDDGWEGCCWWVRCWCRFQPLGWCRIVRLSKIGSVQDKSANCLSRIVPACAQQPHRGSRATMPVHSVPQTFPTRPTQWMANCQTRPGIIMNNAFNLIMFSPTSHVRSVIGLPRNILYERSNCVC